MRAADGHFRRLSRRKCPIASAAALAVALAGCGGDGEDDEPLTVSAASSLAEAFEAYGQETEIDERFSFAGSGDLAAQIRQGAPVDVFASANTSLPEALHEEGLVGEPVTFIANELVLAVPRDSLLLDSSFTAKLDGRSPLELIADLSEIDVVIGAEGVPVGDYTREVLSELPPGDEAAILEAVRSEESDVKGIVAKLTTGAADAGFVYASDVDAAGGEVVGIPLPDEIAPDVEYGVAVVSDTDSAEGAEAFVDGLLEGAGREALLHAEFLPPEGE